MKSDSKYTMPLQNGLFRNMNDKCCKALIRISILVLLLIMVSHSNVKSQTPPPPPPPNNGTNNGHGLGGNQGTAGAPLGNGIEILLIMGTIYAGRMYMFKSRLSEEKSNK